MEAALRGLKAELTGHVEVAGPDLAGSLTDLGLIDMHVFRSLTEAREQEEFG
jgi:hypothetical protein